MSNLIESYEQQYAVLTADITSRIGKLARTPSGSERNNEHNAIKSSFEEVQELLEQMGLEIHDAEPNTKSSLTSRLNCYHAEFKRLKQELQNTKGDIDGNTCEYSDFDDYTTNGITSDQRRRLLDNSERIERTGNLLTEGARHILETERLGADVLQDLSTQREALQKTRSRLRETDADLRQTSRIMNSMIVRSLRERAILFGVGLTFVVVILFSIYHSFS